MMLKNWGKEINEYRDLCILIKLAQPVFTTEFIDSATRINDFLLTSVEWVTRGTYLDC